MARFTEIAEEFRATGVVVYRDVIPTNHFQQFVAAYDALMASFASRQVLHDFLDLEGKDLLTDPTWSDVVLHPLFRLLVEYRLGKPVAIVDVRAKDTYPISIWAKENIVHMDNSPFAEECKVIMTWRKGSVLGSSGQDLVLFPGAPVHRGIRRSENDGQWSSENMTLFAAPAAIDSLIAQRAREGDGQALVVKVSDPLRPLTTVFASSDIPHHRCRSMDGLPRSSVTIAYQPIASTSIQPTLAPGDANKLLDLLESTPPACERVPLHTLEMLPDALERWRTEATSAPIIEGQKRRTFSRLKGRRLNAREFIDFVAVDLMGHDLAALLDLKLYPDAREERRKKSRKMLRELPSWERRNRLSKYQGVLQHLGTSDILTRNALGHIALAAGRRCASAAQRRCDIPNRGPLASLGQLLSDLGEASLRTYSLQCFVSTNLMVLLAFDEAVRLGILATARDGPTAATLARSYVAGTIGHGQLLRARLPDRDVP